ncbi:6-bladed beta-propeller [Pedobacter foliorum]|uniref:6-bladed beta-propeller n=1 Tax=Pedobacter foliorum TaxID=2739058 RepID=UPI0015673B79|nr:6-bladed beta-propeller [Pedobacter foliorum]NRF38558.1 6-bladed beta-propeller [Pedobacter foliorum]
MKLYFLGILAFFCFLVSCSSKKRDNDLGYSSNSEIKYLAETKGDPIIVKVPSVLSSMKKESLVKNFSVIELETTEESLIGNVEQVFLDSGFLFIFDRKNNAILKFDEKGHFLKTIGKKGQGPSEYISLSDATLNKDKHVLSALDLDGRKLITYDYDGNVVGRQQLRFLFNSHRYLKDKLILNTGLYTNINTPAVDLNQLIVADSIQNPIYKSFQYGTALRKSEFVRSSQYPLMEFGKNLYYFTLLSPDTVWSIAEKSKEPAFVLHFQKNYFDDLDQLEISKELMKPRDQAFEGYFSATDDVACFGIIENSRYVFPLFYSKKTGNMIFGSLTGEYSLQNPTPQRLINLIGDIMPSFAIDNERFCKVWEPFLIKNIVRSWDERKRSLLDKSDKKLVDNLKEDGNPILFVYNLNKF